jgi:hypothetical protein
MLRDNDLWIAAQAIAGAVPPAWRYDALEFYLLEGWRRARDRRAGTPGRSRPCGKRVRTSPN